LPKIINKKEETIKIKAANNGVKAPGLPDGIFSNQKLPF
jgi:hypothetical protein